MQDAGNVWLSTPSNECISALATYVRWFSGRYAGPVEIQVVLEAASSRYHVVMPITECLDADQYKNPLTRF